MPLRSALHRGDPKFESASGSDPAPIVSGVHDDHVRKIQLALIWLDPGAIDPVGEYEATAAAPVLAYKRAHHSQPQ